MKYLNTDIEVLKNLLQDKQTEFDTIKAHVLSALWKEESEVSFREIKALTSVISDLEAVRDATTLTDGKATFTDTIKNEEKK